MAIAQIVRKFLKSSAIAANDFAGQATGVRDGDLAQGPSGRLYVCTDTNNSSTSVFARLPVVWEKSGVLAANDFAGPSLVVGDMGQNTTNGRMYLCTASNGSSTSTWVLVQLQRYKASALAANDFAGAALLVGDTAIDTSSGSMYVCTASNGSATSTWAIISYAV